MSTEIRKKGVITILEVEGKLVLGKTSQQFTVKFMEALDAGDRLFVLDMVNVPFVDSSGVGEVIRCHKRAKEKQGTIRLALKGKSHELFVFWELNKLFQIFDDVESALASFAEHS